MTAGVSLARAWNQRTATWKVAIGLPFGIKAQIIIWNLFDGAKILINLYITDAGFPEPMPQGCTIHTQN